MKILITLVALLALGFVTYSFLKNDGEAGVGAEASRQADQFASALFAIREGAAPAPQVSQGSDAARQGTIDPIIANEKFMTATLHTNFGDITIEFMDTDAPNTVANFTKLASAGFYDGTKFHRVIKAFMIQGGDPLTKDDSMQSRWGTGDPGYKFADEIHANNKNNAGTIAMANSGPDTNGSQFFINVANNNFLDGKHTVFGRVTAGMDAVQKIEQVESTASDRPVTPVVINSVTL